ncbi:MAG: hypothetical protein J6O51_10100 [Bacteroidales bacterium]|jgi:acyl carrier protein|nr:hypothetical protein [Bacteroidales bacterium]
MTKETVFEQLKEIFSAVKPKADLSGITMESNLLTDVGVDSLSLLLMTLSIESKFNVRIASDARFDSVSDVVDYIYERVPKQSE